MTTYKELQKQKCVPRGGKESIYHAIWNMHFPNDPILPNTSFVIHHIDHNPLNNDITNLKKMTDTDHKKYHAEKERHPNYGKKFSKELRKKLSDSHKGHIPWNKGKTGIYSSEVIEKNRQASIERHRMGKFKDLYTKKFQCIYCKKYFIIAALSRYHNERCKHKELL